MNATVCWRFRAREPNPFSEWLLEPLPSLMFRMIRPLCAMVKSVPKIVEHESKISCK